MINLTGYKLTFDDEFDSLSVSQSGQNTVWADIRPYWRLNSDADIGFGDSAFVDPDSGIDPFSIQNGALNIQAVQTSNPVVGPGQWASGLLETQNSFSQEYGYFEIRAQLPADTGVWPAFWMMPENDSWPPEIDVFEAYGTSNLYQTVHTGVTGTDTYQTTWSNQPSMLSGFHTYGVLWTPDTITFYFDGNAVGQQATPADLHQPMYLLIDLAMQAVAGVSSDPESMQIDYVRAYSNDPNAVAVPLQPVSSPDGLSTADLHGASTSTPPVSVKQNPLLLSEGGTATVPGSLLQFADNQSGSAQVVYTVTRAPQDGLLLLDGAPTSSFTQADIDSGLVDYQETTPGASVDSFGFTVGDAAGNVTAPQSFQFDIAPALIGAQFGFFTPPDVSLNVVFTRDGSDPAGAVSGTFNLEVITAPSQSFYSVPQGYQGVAVFSGGTGKALTFLAGDINVSDSGPGDIITGGPGFSTIGGGQFDTIIGGSNNEFIDGTQGYESIIGGSAGDETIFGGSGDTITGGGANVVIGGVQFDTIIGGSGTEFIDGSGGNQLITGGSAGNETVYGGAGDTIYGGSGATMIIGGAPGDTLVGGAGTELLDGWQGNQSLTGGSGNETIGGGAGDTITGGSSTEFIDASGGSQLITVGSAGNETIWGGNGDTVSGGAAQGLIGFATTPGAGAEFFSDSGATAANAIDTVAGFSQAAGDRILLNDASAVTTVVATQQNSGGNVTISFSDGSQLMLLGINHIDNTFFA